METQSDSNTHRGVYLCVGQGWHSLVKPLIDYCLAHNIPIHQIKEKFGGLRFYTGAAPDELLDMISEAEKKSYTLCETCGKPGTLKKERGWLRTACEEH